jgi:surface polysaccharide O-acyltransferase-like enzyme
MGTESSVATVAKPGPPPNRTDKASQAVPPKRSAFPDIAKIAAIVAVVTVHVCSAPNENLGILTGRTWFATVGLEIVNRWCVPLFVMVSGMLLLQSRTASLSPQAFYRRRAARVAIPLIGWTLFYRLFTEYTGPHASFEEHVQAIYEGQPYFHLYFVFLIAGLYLVCPYLARAIEGLSQRQLGAMTIGALSLGFLWGGVSPWLPGAGSNAFSMFAPFIGYFLAGCWLARVRLHPKVVPASAAVFLLVAAGASLATYALGTVLEADEWRYLYNYLSPTVIIMSICVFLILRALSERREARAPIRYIGALHYVGEATFGIFLIHPIFFKLWIERPPWVPTEGIELAWWLPATITGLLVVSFVCCVMLKQIPFLRRLV